MQPEKSTNITSAIEEIGNYADTQITLIKYKVTKKGTAIAADLMMDIILTSAFVLAFLFGSIALACFLSDLLHSFLYGFAATAGIYFLLAAVFIIFKRTLERPVINSLIRKLLKHR